jgi:hypothetical protein
MEAECRLDGGCVRHKLKLVTRHGLYNTLQKFDSVLKTAGAVKWRETPGE